MPYLDEFDMHEYLAYYMQGNDIDWSDRDFLEMVLDAAYMDLKKSEQDENYERCHQIKLFMEWMPTRF